MKLKYITSGLLPALFVAGTILFTSCSEDLDIGKSVDDSAYKGIYENSAYLRDAKSNLASNIIELYGDSYTASVKMGLSKATEVATSAKVTVDAAYLDTYNKEHDTDFELYPQDLVTFGNSGELKVDAKTNSAQVDMTIQAGNALQEDKTYALPLTICDPTKDITVNGDAGRCIYLIKDMRKASNAYKGEDAVKGFVFVEVNDANPLNALSFKLENGKLLWDVVVLFAANINWDPVAGRPYVNCNPNVQFLLDNNETYLQPLRKRGIKVLLGFLGNHDQTGLAQLSKQGAQDFAREVAQYCKAYNLDGVNYDDEYSNGIDPNNPALSYDGYPAARLCYETKRLMPDKLVTVFIWGNMYGTSSIDGVDAKDWVDVAVPNYGSAGWPVGHMTNKQCAGLAAEFNGPFGGQLTDSKAQELIDDGFGYFMGFAPQPSNFWSTFPWLAGAKTLYGSKLLDPTVFYKKNDPKPYSYPADL